MALSSSCGLCKFGMTAFGVVGVLAVAGVVAHQDTPTTQPTPATTAPASAPASPPSEERAKEPATDPYVLGCTVVDIDGKDVDLAQFKGKVVLMVNVASKCGFTPQYKGLEALYQAKHDRGLVVLGFPANNFMGQEPGTNTEIKEFCSAKYGVTFPMFEKISVKGEDIHPLYKTLTTQASPIGGDVGWNFTKYLVNREGKVVAKYDSRIKPDDAAMLKRIDELLGPEAKKTEEAKPEVKGS